MTALDNNILTLTEQLDAMLLGWLERHATPTAPDEQATAIITVAAGRIDEIEAFCAGWALRVTRIGGGEKWLAIRVEGPKLPVIGFAQITTWFRT
ncbi:hypothetical protein [Solirubrobacter soli]|uniref:hypothetical protein n=1 Tax=Solirubrobacter soli TaxID=363832 RepID=UPI0003FA9759|nr:hypothetical protein [Solirubrobacter soli]